MKPVIINSFSSGETSAFLSDYLIKTKSDTHEIISVFMNTGEEDEESLIFADKVDKLLGLNLVWLEADVNPRKRKGTRHRVVSFETASRNGEPFADMVRKYGVPNVMYPHCTRELKDQVCKSYIRSLGIKDYHIAIGIRVDEIDRISPDYKKKKLIYPLIGLNTTKIDVNRFWRDMPFRLPIKGYEGNCKVCWKKSLRKLLTIAKHNPERFDNFRKMELLDPEYRFYRGNLTVDDIIKLSKEPFEEAVDDRLNYHQYVQTTLFGYDLDISNGCVESCEAFSAA